MATWICNERGRRQRMCVAPVALGFGLRHPSDLFGGWRVSFSPDDSSPQRVEPRTPRRPGFDRFAIQRPAFEPGTGATLQKNSFTGVAPIVSNPAVCAARIWPSFVYWTGVTPGAQVTT